MKETIKSLKKQIAELKKLAHTDKLTGLLNRRGFEEEFNKFLKQVNNSKGTQNKRKTTQIDSLAIIAFDIDSFKKINDTHGHPAGDRVLKCLADILITNTRSTDIIARWGGDEIIAAMIGATKKEATDIAKNIKEIAKYTTFNQGKKTVQFTVSAGISAKGAPADLNKLLAQADKALYEAKKTKTNKTK